MSGERVPSRSEVMGWSSQQLADYLRRMSLSGCDKAVLKNSITGVRFVNLSDNDLQKFPKLHAPLIRKISSQISKKEEKRGWFDKNRNQAPRLQEPAADVQGWDDDEFDDDDGYEWPSSSEDEGSVGDYESPNEDDTGYETPPSEPQEDPAHKPCPTQPIEDSEYIDNRNNHMSRGPPPVVCPRPPISNFSTLPPPVPNEARREPSPRRPSENVPSGPPQIFRGNKPGREPGPGASPMRASRSTPDKPSTHSWRPAADAPDPPVWSKPPPSIPASNSLGRSNFPVQPAPGRFDTRREQTHDEAPKHNTFPLNKSLPPRPPPGRHGDCLPPGVASASSLPPKLQPSLADHRGSFGAADRFPPAAAAAAAAPTANTHMTQELDPRWYVGRVTRGQAEGCLKRVNKDGAYLVRDSTRQLANQPFTLMVLYQGKVYNIQIRQQNQQFLLGTGLKLQESFPSVSGIISHYSQSPLLLIDAKNRSAGQHNQCLLSDPTGGYMR